MMESPSNKVVGGKRGRGTDEVGEGSVMVGGARAAGERHEGGVAGSRAGAGVKCGMERRRPAR